MKESHKKERCLLATIAVMMLMMLVSYVMVEEMENLNSERLSRKQAIEEAIKKLPGTWITEVHAAEAVSNTLVYTTEQTYLFGEPNPESEPVAETPAHVSLLVQQVDEKWSYLVYGEVGGFIENTKIACPTPVTAVVDISDQKLTVYQNSIPVIETPVVTGKVGRWDTGQGVFTISQKCTNKPLMGGARSDYWLRFHRGQGLHDALWRTEEEFGGDTYLNNGSHGCVNIPYTAMESIYSIMAQDDTVIVQQ